MIKCGGVYFECKKMMVGGAGDDCYDFVREWYVGLEGFTVNVPCYINLSSYFTILVSLNFFLTVAVSNS
jgi:hypothetical protein